MQDTKTFKKEIYAWLGFATLACGLWAWLAFPDQHFLAATIAALAAAAIAILLHHILILPMRRWSALQTSLQTEESLDVQRNFISLLSLNLNTPIAKLLGILQILVETNQAPSKLFVPLQRCLGRALRIQFYSKSTLQTSSLYHHDHKSIQAAALKNILESIEDTLRKLQSFVEIQFEFQHSAETIDFQHYPVFFEQRQISQLVTGIAYILQKKHPQEQWLINFNFALSGLEDQNDQSSLFVLFIPRERLTPECLTLTWFKQSNEPEKDFLLELNREHAQEMLRLYQGSLQQTPQGELLLSLNSLVS